MAILRVITLLIHAIAEAIASLATAILTHVWPALLIVAAGAGAVILLGTSCGFRFLRRRGGDGTGDDC